MGVQVRYVIHSHDANTPALVEEQLVDAARLLFKAPICREWKVERLEQHDTVHAVMPHENNGLIGSLPPEFSQGVGGTRRDVLQ